MNQLMNQLTQKLWLDEDGMGTLEIILIIIALVGVAVLFTTFLGDTVAELLDRIREILS